MLAGLTEEKGITEPYKAAGGGGLPLHADPSRPPGDRYDPSGYGHAVRYAIKAANKAILLQAQAEGRKAEEVQQVPD